MIGLYNIPVTAEQRRNGARLATEVPTAPLAENVTFVLHGCRTGQGTANFAKSLFDHLVAALPNARVFAHTERGCAGRNSSWRLYSSASPDGTTTGALPASLWTEQGCCTPPPARRRTSRPRPGGRR